MVGRGEGHFQQWSGRREVGNHDPEGIGSWAKGTSNQTGRVDMRAKLSRPYERGSVSVNAMGRLRRKHYFAQDVVVEWNGFVVRAERLKRGELLVKRIYRVAFWFR